jgi:serine/threonine protein kinase
VLAVTTAPSGGGFEPGQRIGKYQVLRRLAAGGMAELYLARASGVRGFEKLVALKRAHPHLAADPEFVEMFIDEARIAATLDHPNVVQVLDIGTVGDEYFFVMEYLHGENLRRIMRSAAKSSWLSLDASLQILVEIAEGLHYAHEHRNLQGVLLGLVHRDLSPSNVLVTMDGSVKIVDFGIAKVEARSRKTTAGVLKGKVGYMSPEQCTGQSVDRRSDVFNLGILAYELTVRQRLFYADSDFVAINLITTGQFRRPTEVDASYDPALEAIVLRALASSADDRYPTARAMRDDLEAYASERGLRLTSSVLAAQMARLFADKPYPSIEITEVSASLVEVAPTFARISGRIRTAMPRRWPWVLAALATGILGVGVGWAVASTSRSSADADPPPLRASPTPAAAAIESDTKVEPLAAPNEAAGVDAEVNADEHGSSQLEPSAAQDASGTTKRRPVRKKRVKPRSSGTEKPDRPLFPSSHYD